MLVDKLYGTKVNYLPGIKATWTFNEEVTIVDNTLQFPFVKVKSKNEVFDAQKGFVETLEDYKYQYTDNELLEIKIQMEKYLRIGTKIALIKLSEDTINKNNKMYKSNPYFGCQGIVKNITDHADIEVEWENKSKSLITHGVDVIAKINNEFEVGDVIKYMDDSSKGFVILSNLGDYGELYSLDSKSIIFATWSSEPYTDFAYPAHKVGRYPENLLVDLFIRQRSDFI